MGWRRSAGAISAARREHDGECLLLDSGDLIGDTMIADLTQGKALIEAFNHLRYDAMTIGNHEPDFGMEVLRERIKETNFPVVAANLTVKDDESSFTKPYLIKRVAGTSVGILGLAYPKTARTTSSKNVAGVEFLSPRPAAEEYVPRMRREGADVIVVLSHLGLSGDQELAEAVEGIDVIIGGHSHNRMREALRIGGSLIVQAGAHGSDLGRLDLTLKNGKVTDHRRELIMLDSAAIPADATAQRQMEEIMERHRAALDEEVGKAGDWLVRAQTLAGTQARRREEQSPVDSLFADLIRAETKADAAFLPGVGYGVAIPPGPITAAQLRQLVPHDGKVVTMRLPGSRIMEILEQALENVFTKDSAVKVGGMIQVSGVRFKYRSSLAMGHRITEINCPERRWNPADDFVVATNTMLASGRTQSEIVPTWCGREGTRITIRDDQAGLQT